jgi:hypothetical protein
MIIGLLAVAEFVMGWFGLRIVAKEILPASPGAVPKPVLKRATLLVLGAFYCFMLQFTTVRLNIVEPQLVW